MPIKLEAWNGMNRCRAKCEGPGKIHVHRHCECGEIIDLNHGYCDDCIAALIRGAAMTKHQSEEMFEAREAWLVKYGFVEFSPEGVRLLHA